MDERTQPEHDHHAGTLKRVLGVPSLVFFGLVYMVPLTVFTTYGVVTEITGGRVPAAYVITLVTMVLTARSYAKMASAYPVAGSAYTYVQQSFGPGIGFVAGWALLLDYLFLPMINYLVIGIYMEAALPGVPSWVWILVSIALVTFLNVIGIVSVARTNIAIIVAQLVFIAVFIVLGLVAISGHGTVDPLAPFTTGDESAPGILPLFAGAAVLCLSFLGFDAVSTLSEEAMDARRSVPRAIIIATITGGVIYIVLSFVGHLVLPSHAFTDVDSASLDVMVEAGGQFLSILFTAAYVAGCIGSALTSQASVARILFSMGRDGVLPRRFFGHVSERFSTPVSAIAAVSIVSLVALVIDLTLLSSMISFGALIAFSVVNLSVAKHYFLDERARGGGAVVSYLVLPGLGFALTVWLWTSLSPTSLVVGLLWMAVGVAYLAVVTRGFRRRTPTLAMHE